MNEAKAMEEMKRLKGTQTEKNLAAQDEPPDCRCFG